MGFFTFAFIIELLSKMLLSAGSSSTHTQANFFPFIHHHCRDHLVHVCATDTFQEYYNSDDFEI